MRSIKEINIKYHTYYFCNKMHNIKKIDLGLIKTENKSYKNIDIYYIGYITLKYFDYNDIHTITPLYFILDEVDGYI